MTKMNPLNFWDNSADAWIALADRGDPSRTLMLDEAMLRHAGDVAGLTVCDVGCGAGNFCRHLSGRGAHVTGIDPTKALVERAGLEAGTIHYMVGLGEALPFKSNSFDLIVSYLVLIDIPDFRKAIEEMARIAKPGGRLLIANLNSFCTTRENAWVKDDQGALLHVAVDDYFNEHGKVVSWSGISVVNYHRPFQSYVQALLDAGLQLTAFEEPVPISDSPRMASGFRVPFFHVMQWRKG